MKPALLLLTCERPAMTARTVISLRQHLKLDQFVLLHGDDASTTPDNCDIAAEAGFKTVLRTKKRQGVCHMWRGLIAMAASRGADWVIMQENDWQWVRPYPDYILDYADNFGFDYVRFFGQYKEQGQRPCSPNHLGTGKPINWKPATRGMRSADDWEQGDAHWGFPANATRTRVALGLTRGIVSERDTWKTSAELGLTALRPVENYQFHIGDDRTPGFRT